MENYGTNRSNRTKDKRSNINLGRKEHFIRNHHLYKLSSTYGGCAMTVTVQGYFDDFFYFLILMSAQDLVYVDTKCAENTLHGSYHITASIRATKVPKVPF